MSEKPTNPKDALGVKKVPLHCLPCGPMMEIGLAMMEGGRKYGAHNYRDMGVRFSVYYDAAMRHLMDWWEGEDIDPDSGLHHVVKAIASLIVVRDSMLMGNCDDDRPLSYPNKLNIPAFNRLAAQVIEKYPTCVDPFLERNKKGQVGEPENLLIKEAWQVPANATGHATIECVPSRGWQIRLVDGMFLGILEDIPGINYVEVSVPFYFSKKAEAEIDLSNYLRSKA